MARNRLLQKRPNLRETGDCQIDPVSRSRPDDGAAPSGGFGISGCWVRRLPSVSGCANRRNRPQRVRCGRQQQAASSATHTKHRRIGVRIGDAFARITRTPFVPAPASSSGSRAIDSGMTRPAPVDPYQRTAIGAEIGSQPQGDTRPRARRNRFILSLPRSVNIQCGDFSDEDRCCST